MSTLALNIKMDGKQAIIIGGGTVALRKLVTLLKTGALVTVVSPEICPEIRALENSAELKSRVGAYAATDLDNAFLVVAATDDAMINELVRAEAQSRGIMVVVADNPPAGDCTFPAILQRGDLQIAVSTGGSCPTFAADLRDYIAGHIGNEFGDALGQLAAERQKLLTNGSSSTYNVQVLRSLARRLIAELTERKESLP